MRTITRITHVGKTIPTQNHTLKELTAENSRDWVITKFAVITSISLSPNLTARD